MPNVHSILAPSSANVWGKPDGCPGYVRMKRLMPERSSDEANEGTQAHELASYRLNGEMVDPTLYCQEMIDAVNLYVDDVSQKHPPMPYDREKALEHRDFAWMSWGSEEMVRNDSIHADNFGTVDAWFHSVDGTLTLWDFKYGFREVDAFENLQCLNYAALIIAGPLAGKTVSTIHIRIIQPRAFRRDPIDTWTLSRDEAEVYFNQLRAGAIRAMTPDAPLCAGNHCRDCEAKHRCSALQEASLWSSDYVHATAPTDLSIDDLSRELTILTIAEKALGYRKAGIEAQVEQLLKDGAVFPDWALESKQGKLTWDADPEDIINYGKMFGLDLAKQTVSITAPQAIKAGLPQEIAHMFASRKSGSIKLVNSDINDSMKRLFGTKTLSNE